MPCAHSVRRTACFLAIGALTALILAALARVAASKAAAGRFCAYQDTPANDAPALVEDDAVVCLLNTERARWRLPRLHQRERLDHAAQRHTNDMVARDYFSHTGANGSDPGARVSRAGYNWWVLGENIASGYPTPRDVARAWMASTDHCQNILSPDYRDVGVGVNPRPVRSAASGPATWTTDFGLHAGASPPSSRSGPANGCPH